MKCLVEISRKRRGRDERYHEKSDGPNKSRKMSQPWKLKCDVGMLGFQVTGQ
jgi:hypothetical protein